MSKLVKARVKRREEWPEWARCCSAPLTLNGDDSAEFTVDLERQRDGGAGHCAQCGDDIPPAREVWVLADENGPADWVAFDMIDLAEDPVEVA